MEVISNPVEIAHRITTNPHKTHAGINWIGTSLGVAAKILSEQVVMEYFQFDEVTELSSNWKRVASRSKLFSGDNELKTAEIITQTLPGFEEYFNKYSTHLEGAKFRHKASKLGYAILHRGRHTVCKLETRRFQLPGWVEFYKMVVSKFRDGEIVTDKDRYEAHERILMSEMKGVPGVYLRLSLGHPRRFYLGEGKDVFTRTLTHMSNRNSTNGDLYLARVYETSSKSVAKGLQDCLFSELTPYIVERANPKGPIGSQGWLDVCDGVNPLALVDSIVNDHYRGLARVTRGYL